MRLEEKINKCFFDCIVFNSYFLEYADFWVLSADGYLSDDDDDPKRFEIFPQTLDSSFTSEQVAEHLKQEADCWLENCNRYVVLHEGNEIKYQEVAL